jgi:hypothetical protein
MEEFLPPRPNQVSFPKTTVCLNWLEYVLRRLDTIVWESKRLVFGAAFLIFLIYELAHFAKFLLKNWSG